MTYDDGGLLQRGRRDLMRKTAAATCGAAAAESLSWRYGEDAYVRGRSKMGKTGGGARSALQPGVRLCIVILYRWREVGRVRPLRPVS